MQQTFESYKNYSLARYSSGMKFREWLHNAWIDFKITDGIIACMAIASVIVAGLQYATTQNELGQIKRSADQTDRALQYAQTQAEAAKSEAQTARETFQLAFRPNLTIQMPVFTQSSPDDLTVLAVRNSGAGSATNVVFRYELLLGTKVLEEGQTSSALLAAGDYLTGRPQVSRADASTFLMGPKPFTVRATIEYDTGPAGRAETCSTFTYDPAARAFSPDTGCGSLKKPHSQ